jgi:CubicO group peptidase (beta-lactamase class C family)
MKKLALTLLILILIISCQSNNKNEFENKVMSEIKKTDIPAVVMGKIHKSGQMDFYSFGPSRYDRNDTISKKNIFRIASMTKAIASVAALQLVERGKITLDEPLDKFLPEMTSIPILNDNIEIVKPKKSITLRHLLTHTAGFGYDFTSPKLNKWNTIKNGINWQFNYEPRVFEAGSSFLYGTNIDWVGVLIEKISGINLEDYLRKNITGPLQMNSTWFNVPDELSKKTVTYYKRDRDNGKLIPQETYVRKKATKFNAGGGLSSSPEDYGKFLLCMINKGALYGIRILKEETFDLLNSPQLTEFKQIHRSFPNRTNNEPRGDKDTFYDNYDNWTLAWGYDENSIVRPVGTAYWAGIRNTFFTIDFKNDFALVYMTQLNPFNDMNAFNLFTSFERLIYEDIKSAK